LQIIPSLKQKFKWIIVLDFLGFGYSDKPRFHSYSIFEQADIVQEILSFEKIKNVHILAHDYGDTVAQELLYRDQNQLLEFKINSVCLLNGGIFPDKYYPRLSQKVLMLPIIGTITAKLISFPFVRAGLCELFGPNTQPHSEELHNFWSIMQYQEGYRAWGSILNYIQERNDNEERWVSAIQKATVPVYMIYGPADPVNPPPFAEHYRKMIPKPLITVLPNHIGHYVQLEAPEEMIENYFNFLDNLANNNSTQL
ncbi:mesoderm-specific transcript protein-like, partial [Centruroides sculpturatus]|uniref:mesoderm-specific transcript protein-like n=1 Tax=Centruroides sculpturatus TaxID=218467 RepID=UPI000C6E8754